MMFYTHNRLGLDFPIKLSQLGPTISLAMRKRRFLHTNDHQFHDPNAHVIGYHQGPFLLHEHRLVVSPHHLQFNSIYDIIYDIAIIFDSFFYFIF